MPPFPHAPHTADLPGPALRQALGLRSPWVTAWQAHSAALALPAYLATLATGTAALVAWKKWAAAMRA